MESEYTREIQLSDTFHHRREIEGVRKTRVRDLEKLNAAEKKPRDRGEDREGSDVMVHREKVIRDIVLLRGPRFVKKKIVSGYRVLSIYTLSAIAYRYFYAFHRRFMCEIAFLFYHD